MIGLVLFLLFIVLPFVELALLVWIGGQIGFWPTLAIVLGTGFLGALLARAQGGRAWREVVGAWQEGKVPARQLVAGGWFLVGAAFLLTPGVITDTVGFLLMVPPVRLWAAKATIGLFTTRSVQMHSEVIRIRKID